MNVENTLRLNDWVGANCEWLGSAERGTLEEAAVRAAKELGFKVNASNLAAVMKRHGIITKRMSNGERKTSVMKAEIERQNTRIEELLTILAKVEAVKHLPDQVKFVLGNISEEIRRALDERRRAA